MPRGRRWAGPPSPRARRTSPTAAARREVLRTSVPFTGSGATRTATTPTGTYAVRLDRRDRQRPPDHAREGRLGRLLPGARRPRPGRAGPPRGAAHRLGDDVVGRGGHGHHVGPLPDRRRRPDGVRRAPAPARHPDRGRQLHAGQLPHRARRAHALRGHRPDVDGAPAGGPGRPRPVRARRGRARRGRDPGARRRRREPGPAGRQLLRRQGALPPGAAAGAGRRGGRRRRRRPTPPRPWRRRCGPGPSRRAAAAGRSAASSTTRRGRAWSARCRRSGRRRSTTTTSTTATSCTPRACSPRTTRAVVDDLRPVMTLLAADVAGGSDTGLTPAAAGLRQLGVALVGVGHQPVRRRQQPGVVVRGGHRLGRAPALGGRGRRRRCWPARRPG